MTPEKLEAFRATGDGWLKEAKREELPQRIRADAAFDAAYMYSRVAMAGADEELRHPHPGVLTGAAERLDWNAGDMAIAVKHLADWYEPLCGHDRLNGLLAIALRLQAAVDTNIKTQA
ncbi:hypothetical protein [Rhodoferax ferrireducens]|uniref:hypothetical protein n=1 Tax=Rhodoferax ferrireducens TaxID=192843 RepID=UPI000E0CD217|nr:hypothetical protein [Rhodoferax ferrireducens]